MIKLTYWRLPVTTYVHVNYNIYSAVAGYDYENATQTLNFGSEDSMMCINVTVIDDDKVEGNETFTISLSVNTTDVSYTFVGPMQATVIIVDNDGTFTMVTNPSKHLPVDCCIPTLLCSQVNFNFRIRTINYLR